MDPNALATPEVANILTDNHSRWGIKLHALVAGRYVSVDPAAYSWTTDAPEIATVDANGIIIGLRNGTTVATGTNAAGSVSVNITVECTPADKTTLDPDGTIDVNTWKVTRTSIANSVEISPINDVNGLNISFKPSSMRGARLALTKDLVLFSQPDAIEFVVKPETSNLKNFSVSLNAQGQTSVKKDFGVIEAGKETTLRIDLKDVINVEDMTSYPVRVTSLSLEPSKTGQQTVKIESMKVIYKKFDGVEDVNADNDNVLRVAVANGFVSISFRAAELTLTDLAGRVVAHAVDAAEVASPAAAGVYVLSARTSAGTISAKVYVR